MFKCKLCGAANTPDSSVCIRCGAALDESSTNSAESNNEIFSSADSGGRAKKEVADLRKEIYSSDSTYEKARHRKVLEKIRIQEEALGEVPNPDKFEKAENKKVEPIVINRNVNSDVVGKPKIQGSRNGGSRPSSGKHSIPQRVIEPVDSQTIRRKIRSAGSPSADSGEKVELKPSESIENIQKKRQQKNSNKNGNNSGKNSDYKDKKKRDKSIEKQGEKTLKEFEKKRHSEEKRLEREEILEEHSQKRVKEQILKNKPVQRTTDGETAEPTQAKKPMPKKKPVQQTTDGETAEPTQTKKLMPKKKPVQRTADGETAEPTQTNKPMPKKKPVQQTADGETAEPTQAKKPMSKKKPVQRTADGETAEPTQAKKPMSKKKPVQQTTDGETAEPTQAKKPMSKKKQIQRTTDGETTEPTQAKKPMPKKKATSKTETRVIPPNENESDRYVTSFSDEDVEENKNLAALAYIGILFVLPLAKRDESKFCKAHVRQGIATFVYSIIVCLVSLLAVCGLRFLLVWTLKLPFVIFNIATLIVTAIMIALVFIPTFNGALAAFSGTYKKIPIVGRLLWDVRKSKGKKSKKVKKAKRTKKEEDSEE